MICLNAGNYGNISLSSKSYSSDVTVEPASNAAVTIGSVTLDTVAHLHITGIGGGTATLSMGFIQIDLNSGCSSNLTFDYYTSTGGVNIIPKYSCSHGMAILFDHDRFDNLGQNTWEGRINVQGLNTGPSSADGVTVSNSHFGGAGGASQCSDGIDILGDAAGTVIGPGNEFTGIDQGYSDANCGGTHVDPIQQYGGGPGTVVTGNYFHDNGSGTGGIAGFAAGDTPQITVTNNVFGGTVYSGQNAWLSGDGDVVTHNAFVDTGGGGGTGDLRIYNAGATSTVTNNMFAVNNWVLDSGCCTVSYDVNGTGTGNVTGTPVYVSSPASGYYHYQLAPNSPGYHAASDGKSMGITP